MNAHFTFKQVRVLLFEMCTRILKPNQSSQNQKNQNFQAKSNKNTHMSIFNFHTFSIDSGLVPKDLPVSVTEYLSTDFLSLVGRLLAGVTGSFSFFSADPRLRFLVTLRSSSELPLRPFLGFSLLSSRQSSSPFSHPRSAVFVSLELPPSSQTASS